MRRFLTIFLIVIAVLAAIVVLTPWPVILGKGIAMFLNAQGFHDSYMKITRLNRHGATVEEIGLAGKDFSLTADSLMLEFPGAWQMKNVILTAGKTTLPTLAGNGVVTLLADRTLLEGRFASADNSHNAAFNVIYVPNNKDQTRAYIVRAAMPWNEGTLTVNNATIPVTGGTPINLNLQLKHVSAHALLQLLTSNHVAATGTISGTLPVTIEPNGTFTIGTGSLTTDGPGTLNMDPAIIPGDNPQVGMVRDLMQDFRYTALTIASDHEKDKKLALRMTVSGNNPAVQEGRPVKLTVNLTGDVLDFVQQNVMLLLDPTMLLKQIEQAE